MKRKNKTAMDLSLELDEALRIAQQCHIAIVPTERSIKLWSPGVRVPGPVRLAIMANRQTIRRLIGQSHVSVCVNPELHKSYHGYRVRCQCCDICAKLNYWLRQTSTLL